jgi:hypothetical protein
MSRCSLIWLSPYQPVDERHFRVVAAPAGICYEWERHVHHLADKGIG